MSNHCSGESPELGGVVSVERRKENGNKFEISEIGVLSHILTAEYLHIWSDVSRTACGKHDQPETDFPKKQILGGKQARVGNPAVRDRPRRR